jgi:hypothetical protein
VKDEEALGGCLVFILLIMLIPVSAWWSGWVMLQNYNWFIAPVQGAPKLAIGNMLGFSLIMNMMLAGHVKTTQEDKDKSAMEAGIEALAKMALIPALFLFFGWLYHMWFM